MTRPPRLLVLLAGAAAAVACIPLVYLIVRAVEGGTDSAALVLGQPRVWQSAAISLTLAAATAAASIVLGVPAALLVARARIRARRAWIVFLIMPLAVPSFVSAYAWASILPGFSGFTAAWIVLTASTLPYVILPALAALRSIDPAHEEVARTLGLRPLAAFLRAALPQLWPAVGGGALLVALYALSDFGAVSILRVDTLSRAIYSSYRASFDRSSAAVLALLLVLLAIIVVAVEQHARGRAARWRLATAAPRQPPPVPLGAWAVPSFALALIIGGAGVVVPLVATLEQLATGSSAGLDLPDLGGALLTSVTYGAAGMVAALVLAIPVGVLAGKYPSASSRSLERVAFVGHALPGVVVGLSLVFVGTRLAPAIYQTVFLLAFAYGVLFLPKAAAAVRGSIAAVPPVLEDVARTLGASPLRAFGRVTARLAAPGIAAGAILVLLTVIKELPATLMLHPTGQETLATRLWSFANSGAYASAAPYSLALIIAGAIPAFALAWPLVKQPRPGGLTAASEPLLSPLARDGDPFP